MLSCPEAETITTSASCIGKSSSPTLRGDAPAQELRGEDMLAQTVLAAFGRDEIDVPVRAAMRTGPGRRAPHPPSSDSDSSRAQPSVTCAKPARSATQSSPRRSGGGGNIDVDQVRASGIRRPSSRATTSRQASARGETMACVRRATVVLPGLRRQIENYRAQSPPRHPRYLVQLGRHRMIEGRGQQIILQEDDPNGPPHGLAMTPQCQINMTCLQVGHARMLINMRNLRTRRQSDPTDPAQPVNRR